MMHRAEHALALATLCVLASTANCGGAGSPSDGTGSSGSAGSAGKPVAAGSGGSAPIGGGGGGVDLGGSAGEGGESGEGSPPATVQFRLLTLNRPKPFTNAQAAKDISESSADTVGLQEVQPGDVAAIAALLGAEWEFVQEDRDNTFAIVSKRPILQRIGVTEQTRGGIGATIQLDAGVRVHVFTTHGMYTPYGPYQLAVDRLSIAQVVKSENDVRMPALNELLELAAPYVDSSEATFLTGDFNAPSHLDYDPPLPWPTSLAVAEAGFADSYAVLHPGNVKKSAGKFAIDDPGITWTQLAKAEPNACFDRIDFIYSSNDDARPVESHVIDVSSSDHRAVLTTFEIEAPARGSKAQSPLPGSTQLVGRHALLSWTPAKGATSERVFLGVGSPSALAATVNESHWLTPLLLPGTTYAWRVESGDTWTFQTRISGGLEPDQRTYAPGTTLTITFDGGNATRDWIGIHPRKSAYGVGSPATVWKYLNGSATAPAAVVAKGTLTLTAPSAPGPYMLRFFDNDTYSVEDELAITVR